MDDPKKRRTLNFHGHRLIFGERTLIMGILNVTPDSFSDGGQFFDLGKAVAHAMGMVREGADIIDVGGESTRPGSEGISDEEELRRVIPVIKELVDSVDVPISIDTCKSKVAEEAMKAGASILNDISALRSDPNMVNVAKEHDVPLILMHMQGTPKSMQKNPKYEDVMGEIISFLKERVGVAVRSGIDRDKIIVDPGIGFGKSIQHNYEIIRRLSELEELNLPIMIGTSRKSFIGFTLDLPVEDRLEGTLATVAATIINGADIIRVHDVKECKRAARMIDAVYRKEV